MRQIAATASQQWIVEIGQLLALTGILIVMRLWLPKPEPAKPTKPAK